MCSTGHTWGVPGINAARDRCGRRVVGDLRSRLRPSLQTYLVVFDGEDWAEVVPMRARNVTEVASSYPEATVLEHRPVWMSVEEYDRLRYDAAISTVDRLPSA